MRLVLSKVWRVREIDAGNTLVLPDSAETGLVVEQAKLLDDIVHDQVDVDLRLVAHRLFVGFAQLAYLANVESLVRVELKHTHDDTAKFR